MINQEDPLSALERFRRPGVVFSERQEEQIMLAGLRRSDHCLFLDWAQFYLTVYFPWYWRLRFTMRQYPAHWLIDNTLFCLVVKKRGRKA